MNDLIFESFAVRPLSFIRKSQFELDMKTVLTSLRQFLDNNSKIITLNFNGRKTGIKMKDIIYLESYLHSTHIITINSTYTYRCTIQKLINIINSTTITKVHRSYAVNLFWIKVIQNKEVILLNNSKIRIGGKFQKEFIRSYKDYLLK
ncbi:MAG: LytTR family transcriptional regulator DNA-binding domain-containing protein [Coprobacillaceae bacterium]